MLRLALITYLTMATLAGPAWCCCTLTRLAANTLRLIGSTESAVPRTCCRHHSTPAEQVNHPGDQRDSHCPAPRDHDCPCKPHPSEQQVALPFDSQAAAQSWLLFMGQDLVSLVAVPVPLVPECDELANPSHFDRSGFQHLTGSDILRLLQVFRC